MMTLDPFAVSAPPNMRSSSRSWASAHCRNLGHQSTFISRDGNTVDNVSRCKEITETKFNQNLTFFEEDFIQKSKALVMTDSKWKLRMSHRSQNSFRFRTAVSKIVLSYVSVILLLLALFADVSPSISYDDDLCLNVTWSGSERCNCSMYSLNVSSCTNNSRFDDLQYFCSCGDTMDCDISVLNSNDSESLLGNCSCSSGYTGLRCETLPTQLTNVCSNVSCLNGATCVEDSSNSSSYQCRCPMGFDGSHCELNINSCNETDFCQNNGTCVYGVGGYTCNCTEGYYGEDCNQPNCTNVNCHNGGVCSVSGTQWSCNCSAGYTGLHCEADVNECNMTNYCQNNGTCLNFDGGYSCSCFSGYTGSHCESDVNECDRSDICLNNGNCSNFGGGYNCTCIPGYSGENCADHNACFFNPCQNNGSCVNWNNTYNCSCTHGFTGLNCSEIDRCATSPCVNGTCLNTNNGYECSCLPGYAGMNCSEIDHCASNPCVNGTCKSVDNGYNCSCLDGFFGTRCDIDPCAKNPCINGHCHPLLTTGNCSITNPCRYCTCFANYTGANCEHLIDSSPSSADNSATVGLIAGLTVGLFVLLVIIVALILAIIVRNKRRNLGTYHPSRQEVANARLEINGGLKPPPEERLI